MKKSMAIPIDDDFPLDGNNWEDLDDNEQCIVCFEHLPDTVFIECGHRYFELSIAFHFCITKVNFCNKGYSQ